MSERKSQQELDFERKHEEDLQRLRGLRLIDDDFMAAVFEERACAEFLLQIILKRDDLTVKEVHGQYSIKNLQGRSVRLDILAVDRENRAYNIEVQRSDRGHFRRIARVLRIGEPDEVTGDRRPRGYGHPSGGGHPKVGESCRGERVCHGAGLCLDPYAVFLEADADFSRKIGDVH